MSLILVVDDEPDILMVVQMILRGCGHQILEASTGEMALQLLEHQNPDAVLLDVRLPGIDGLEVLERLRKASIHSVLPVIMLSASSGPSLVERASGLGCSGFVAKPFDPEALIRTLNEALEAGRTPAA